MGVKEIIAVAVLAIVVITTIIDICVIASKAKRYHEEENHGRRTY